MDWTAMWLPRSRILSDGGNLGTYPEIYWSTPPIDPYRYSTTRSYQASRLYRRVWDTVVPNYQGEIRAGRIINNDLLDFRLDSSYSPMLCFCDARAVPTYTTQYTWGNLLGITGGAAGIVAIPPGWVEALALVSSDEGSLRDEAVTTSFARVDVSELEMLASLGEMPETVEWFRDVLRRLIGIIADIKRKQYLSALDRLKIRHQRTNLAKAKKTYLGSEDAWMEWRYAIRPLILEVKAYLEALDSRVEKASRKTARFRNIDEATTHSVVNTTGGVFNANVQRTVRTTRSIRSGVLYALEPEKMGWWTHLGLDAPVSAVYAITRLSFVLDWFFNIGQWIASWEPRVGLTPLTNWVVETRTIEVTGVPQPLNVPWPGYTILSRSVTDVGGYSCKAQVKARWANPDRQLLPTFNYRGLKVAQVADLVVIGRKLTSQLFR